MTPDKKNDEKDSRPEWANYLGLGTELAVTIAAMAYLGVWLDKKFNTHPVLIIICSFVGVAAGLYNFIRAALKSR